jgi:uroporphyrinogen decarboxylase
MNSVERITSAFRGEMPDRVSVVARLSPGFLLNLFARSISLLELYDVWIQDPFNAEYSVIRMQEEWGLDPIVVTQSHHFGEMEVWPRRLLSYPSEAGAAPNWRESKAVLELGSDFVVIRRTAKTPKGELSWTYRIQNHSTWPLEYLLEDENDIDLLEYLPDPSLMGIETLKGMVARVGARAFFRHAVSGVWNEASELRGAVVLAMDIYDRPGWVKQLLEIVKERLIKHVYRLGETGIHAIAYIQDWLGMGVSPAVYEEFMYPYDKEVIEAAHHAGLLVSYHICGKGSRLLEQIASTGTDALETLTPPEKAGDFDLADAKARVGDRICLFGGFDERVLSGDDYQLIRDEAKQCLAAAASGGRYIMHCTGNLTDAKPESIRFLTDFVREHGIYRDRGKPWT